MAHIPAALRQLVTDRAHGLCEYCRTAQAIVIEMEIDHIIPISVGGETVADNLCLSCISCNAHKRNFINGTDPQSGQEVPLFDPRNQHWSEHFSWQSGGTLIAGNTPAGRATVERLGMNREVIVQARLRWVQAGWHPPD